MNGARKVYRGLLILFLALIAIQFLLAGFGVFSEEGPFGDDMDPHRIVGNLLGLLALILLILAAVGRVGKPLLPMTAALFVLTLIQGFLAIAGQDTNLLGALHTLNALLIFTLAFHLFQRVRAGLPEHAGGGGPPAVEPKSESRGARASETPAQS